MSSLDIKEGGSITEPALQGGTPEEGLTWEVYYLTSPCNVKLEDKVHSPFFPNDENGMDDFSVAFGNYSTIVKARKLADRYFSFISDVLSGAPEIREVFRNNKSCTIEETDSTLAKYADLEWGRKEEALDIARELKSLYDENVKYLTSLLGEMTEHK